MALARPADYETCLRSFVGLHRTGTDEDFIAKAAILAYAVHAVVNHLRHHSLANEHLQGALRQAICNAVRGHAAATNVVDSSWVE